MQRLGDKRRNSATAAEAEFERILNSLGDGVLRTKFTREWVCGKNYVVDFFFPEIRLAIEIDGSYHNTLTQAFRDARRELEIESYMVTIVRFTNAEVFGDREALVEKLREAWKRAKLSLKRSSRAPMTRSIAASEPTLKDGLRASGAAARALRAIHTNKVDAMEHTVRGPRAPYKPK
jgi:very-short-patch-repair endonuclease